MYIALSIRKTRCHSVFRNCCCSDVNLGLKLLVKMDFTRKAQNSTSHLQLHNADDKEKKISKSILKLGNRFKMHHVQKNFFNSISNSFFLSGNLTRKDKFE